jgi:UDP-N-acetylmuramyl pentapeptide phosphotransferase/UDP-N-acetylglucosamine-1-phosphate transferase
MPIIPTLIYLAFFFLLELLYFKIAERFDIIDHPNHRSSHDEVTIRGGGIIFSVAVIVWFLTHGFQYPFFVAGVIAIAIISFLDDKHTLNNKIRLAVHFLSVALLFKQWQLGMYEWYWLLVAAVFVIGSINAYNFMDGINGITGSYSLLTIGTLYYINEQVTNFVSSDLLMVVGLSLLVFNFFNFRKRAKCFAGDVGSISIALVVVFLIGQLVIKTENFTWILLLMVYGLDTAVTVFFRKIRKENIFEAHRTHFYQYLSNELKWPHLWVSLFYVLVQLSINVMLISDILGASLNVLFFFVFATAVFLVLRFVVEGKNRLLKPH